MYRVLVTAGLLCAALGKLGLAAPATATAATAPATHAKHTTATTTGTTATTGTTPTTATPTTSTTPTTPTTSTHGSEALSNAKKQVHKKAEKTNSADSHQEVDTALNLLEVQSDWKQKSHGSSSDWKQYLTKYASGGKGNSQTADYQKYMNKYTDGQSGNYQTYLQEYAGKQTKGYQNYANYQKYMNQYSSGDNGYGKYADYQKYIERYSKHSNLDTSYVRSAHDAQDVSQLDAWRSHQKQNVVWYVPDSGAKYADSNIDRQYKQRLAELQGNAVAKDDTADSIINLDAVAPNQVVEHLKGLAEADVDRAEKLSASLKRASDDTDAINAATARPQNNVYSAFTHRAKAVDDEVKNLQQQMKAGQFSANFAMQYHDTEVKVTKLRDDELHALNQAHHEANEAARHAARGAQTQVRKDARQVRTLTDRMAAKNQSYQGLANELQNRAEAAAEVTENHCEDLARRTQDRLEENLDTARDDVRKASERRSNTLKTVQQAFETTQTQQTGNAAKDSFLANVGRVAFSAAPLASFAVFSVAGACLAFLFNQKRRRINLNQNILG